MTLFPWVVKNDYEAVQVGKKATSEAGGGYSCRNCILWGTSQPFLENKGNLCDPF